MAVSRLPPCVLVAVAVIWSCHVVIPHVSCLDIVVERDTAREMLDPELELILTKHNQMRRDQQATDMEYMYYHRELERQAKDWADQCRWEHGLTSTEGYNYEDDQVWSSVGQNLWMSSGAYSEADGAFNLEGAIDAWYGEIKDYDVNSHVCQAGKVCGHYTQIVWASTNYVGCAYKYCDVVTRSDGTKANGRHLLVCNYGPPGNYVGQNPFLNGSPGEECTFCGSGYSECDDGLCRRCSEKGGNCECAAQCHNCGTAPTVNEDCKCSCASGWYGTSCQTPCVDGHRNCGNGWYEAQCTDMDKIWDSVRSYCLVMCGYCEETPVSSNCAVDRANFVINGPEFPGYDGRGVGLYQDRLCLGLSTVLILFVSF